MSPMMWGIGLLAVLVIGLAVLAAQGRLGAMPPLVDDREGPDLPAGEISAGDLRGLRFAVVTRGYAPEQVDAVLARLAEQLEPVTLEEPARAAEEEHGDAPVPQDLPASAPARRGSTDRSSPRAASGQPDRADSGALGWPLG